MENSVIFYLDSSDAAKARLNVSPDFAYCLLSRVPTDTQLDAGMNSQEDVFRQMLRFLQTPESISFVFVDRRLYRYLMSIAALFRLQGRQEGMRIFVEASSQIYDSLEGDFLNRLLTNPDVSMVEYLLNEIRLFIIARYEEKALDIVPSIRELNSILYDNESESVIRSFQQSDENIIPFSLSSRKEQLVRLINPSDVIRVCNQDSMIRTLSQNQLNVVEPQTFMHANDLCLTISNAFSDYLLKGMDDEENKSTYRRIWTFILKTHSSCYLSPRAYELARQALLSN